MRPGRGTAGFVVALLSVSSVAGAAAPQAPGLKASARDRRCSPSRTTAAVVAGSVTFGGRTYRLYPDVLREKPSIPSPLTAADGTELMVAVTRDRRYSIVPVTLKPESRQCEADGADFPTFASTGLHADVELAPTRAITGRTLEEIADLARPGRLSTAGFLGRDEDLLGVLRDDNRTVAALRITHPDLARPLFHLLNMMQADIDLGRWNMATHRWHNITSVISHGRTVHVVAGDTKGGQQSIFADGLDGSLWFELKGEITDAERAFLKARYPALRAEEMAALVRSLTCIRSGDMEPFYITAYGFYEGTTPWRTDPVALAFVFGLRTLEQIETAFPGRLYGLMMARFVPFEPSAPSTGSPVANIRR
jgi:hypothetical protein